MANEILLAGIADLTTAEVLNGEYLLLLADRNALPNHPALMNVGSVRGRGSNVIKTSELGLMGYDLLAATGDGATVANTALTDGSANVTVSRYSKAYEASDITRFIDSQGILNSQTFAADAFASQQATLANAIAGLVDNFSNTVGSGSSDMSVATFVAAQNALEAARVNGPYMAILHPVAYGQFRSDLATAVGGTVQYMLASQDQLVRMGGGYKGSFLGTDVFTHSNVLLNTDYYSGMFGRGALLFSVGAPDAEGSDQLLIGGQVLFERVRDGRSGLTAYVSHSFLGVAEGIDACGVTIVSDT
jgi:hypothetical protein